MAWNEAAIFFRFNKLISTFCIVVGSLETGGDSDGDYSDEDDQGSETNGSMTEDYTDIATDLATDVGGNHGDKREMNVMRQQMEGRSYKNYYSLCSQKIT